MTAFEQSRTIDCPADTVYGVLADVEKHSLFMPFCKNVEITSMREDGSQESLEAQYLLRSRKFAFERVVPMAMQLDHADRRMRVEYGGQEIIRSTLVAKVDALSEGSCQVTLNGDYEIKGLAARMFAKTLGVRTIFNKILGRVEDRAREINRA